MSEKGRQFSGEAWRQFFELIRRSDAERKLPDYEQRALDRKRNEAGRWYVDGRNVLHIYLNGEWRQFEGVQIQGPETKH